MCDSLRRLVLVLIVFAAAVSAAAETAIPAAGIPDAGWPQYRGPQRDGTVSAAGLAEAWPENGPVELWRRSFGSGFSAVIASGGVAYTMEAEGAEEAVIALDAKTGKTLWRTVVGEPMESEFGRGPRATPALAGGKLYTVSSKSRLLCLNAETGAILWDKDLSVYDPVPRFGYAVSPMVTHGLVIVDVGTKDLVDAARAKAMAEAGIDPAKAAEPAGEGEQAQQPEIEIPPQIGAVAAFDAATGELRWRGGFGGPAGYSSPVVATLAGVEQLVYSRGTRLAGLSFDGKVLWEHPTEPKGAIPMPVILPGDVVFVSASDDHFGGLAVKVKRDPSGAWSTEPAWSERLMRNHFNTSVTVGDTLYGFDNTTFKALDAATGQRKWAHRGFGKGSLLAAGDLLYVLGDDGTLALVHAGAPAYEEAGRVQAMTGKAWTAPSLADGILLLRDHDEIVAYDVRQATIAQVGGAQVGGAQAAEGSSEAEADPAEREAARQAAEAAAKLPAAEILARHAKARGGENWQKIRSLEMSGTYSAFSETSNFTLHRSRAGQGGEGGEGGDQYKLEYFLFGIPGIRALGPTGPWLQHAFLSPVPIRVADEPQLAAYDAQMRREALFGPLLLRAEELGLAIETAGVGEINGRPTVNLKVTFPMPEAPEETPAEAPAEAGQQAEAAAAPQPVTETWYLDPHTFLEVAVDSEIVDYTQGPQVFRQRAFYGDFRAVDGVMIPFRLDLEFNARFEGMTVEKLAVNGAIDPGVYVAPPPPPAQETAAEEAPADDDTSGR